MTRLDVRPITPHMGAEVDAGDLRKVIASGEVDDIHRALLAHQVLFFRNQTLTPTDLVEFASLIGTPMVAEPFGFLGETNPVSTFEITRDRPPRADLWHTDLTFMACPPAFGMLYNIVAPKVGGDTMWVNSYGAYELLSPVLQQFCDGLRAEHAPNEGVRTFIVNRDGVDAARAVDAAFPPIEHPLVVVHPDTKRKSLFISRNFMNHIVGLHPEESALLTTYLLARFDNPNLQVRWHWQPGDLAVWDERSTNHRALSDHYPSDPHRIMQTVFVSDARVPSGVG